MTFYHPAEGWDREEIERAQRVRLQNSVEQALKSPFYSRRLGGLGITAKSIESPESIRDIPFTTKADLRSAYPYEMLCVPRGEIVRLHASSGTTGSPVVVCHTQDDLNTWADLMARCMYMVGVRKSDVFQNMAGYGL